ncbi:MAG: hypothetical protein LBH53_01505 [Puniceicoccales bacterium]|jgi:hypothetical protein|nr:hypothetical protein [Puniceicoccales bacterium]
MTKASKVSHPEKAVKSYEPTRGVEEKRISQKDVTSIAECINIISTTADGSVSTFRKVLYYFIACITLGVFPLILMVVLRHKLFSNLPANCEPPHYEPPPSSSPHCEPPPSSSPHYEPPHSSSPHYEPPHYEPPPPVPSDEELLAGEGEAGKFVIKLNQAISAGKVQPTASGILGYVQTKAKKIEHVLHASFFNNVAALLWKTSFSFQKTAALVVLAFSGGHIYKKEDAQNTYISNAVAYEMNLPDDPTQVRIVKELRYNNDEHYVSKVITQNMAASALGKYFYQLGAPSVYVESSPAFLDDELAISMSKARGRRFDEEASVTGCVEIAAKEFGEIVRRVCSEAKDETNYLALASDFTLKNSSVCVPRVPFLPLNFGNRGHTPPLYTDSSQILVRFLDQGGANFAPLPDAIAGYPGYDARARGDVDDNMCCLNDLWGQPGENFKNLFLFRPFRADDGSIVYGVRYHRGARKITRLQIPFLPSEAVGNRLCSATWLRLADYVVHYTDRCSANNTFMDEHGNVQSIDFDGCLNDWHGSPSFFQVDESMESWVNKLDLTEMEKILRENGLSAPYLIEALSDRVNNLKEYVAGLRKSGRVIADGTWGKQGPSAYARTYLSKFLGPNFGANVVFQSILPALSAGRDTLAPKAGQLTAEERYVAEFCTALS